ncbi:MAG: hypothetical protein US70_C0013G0015 [Parcubacteria group bacterium GW2011_GWD2_38_11]|nr:MAG: hypothetical protein US70_C0013G0015 [Parcubacteria group bacterium GW2011_GWD2_38_11]
MTDQSNEELNNVDGGFCVVKYGRDSKIAKESLPSQNLGMLRNLQIIAGENKHSVVVKKNNE